MANIIFWSISLKTIWSIYIDVGAYQEHIVNYYTMTYIMAISEIIIEVREIAFDLEKS